MFPSISLQDESVQHSKRSSRCNARYGAAPYFEGAAEIGYAEDEGFAVGDPGVIDVSLLFGMASAHQLED